jgi:uncharacterized membrane protein HdeD (DUF308 family)
MTEMSSVRVSGPAGEHEPIVLAWWIPLVTGIAWLVYSLIILSATPKSVTAIAVFFAIAAFGVAGLEVIFAFATRGGWRWAHFAMAAVATIAAILAFAYPDKTFVIMAWIAGWLILARGVFDLCGALWNRDRELWWIGLIAGLAEIAIAFWAIGHWGNLATLLIVWLGLWTLLRGIMDIVAAFRARAINRDMGTGPPPAYA